MVDVLVCFSLIVLGDSQASWMTSSDPWDNGKISRYTWEYRTISKQSLDVLSVPERF